MYNIRPKLLTGSDENYASHWNANRRNMHTLGYFWYAV